MTQSTFHSDARPSSERMRNEEAENHDDDTTFEDPRIARERAEERERAKARAQARDHAELMRDEEKAHDEPNDRARFGTSFLAGENTEENWQQWRQIQADFVDNPRSAVAKAHGLVAELINDIVRKFENERNQLEQRWSSGEDVSTEDLRRCLQTYRDFFGRLLAKAGEAKA